MQSLRRQARQASKYKELSEELRKAEAVQYHVHWSTASEQVATEEVALQGAMRIVGQLTQAEAEALRGQNDSAEMLQPLREREAVRAAVLRRLDVERNTLDAEEARARQRQVELEARLVQLQKDADREEELVAEARDILVRLAEEEEALPPDSDNAGARAEATSRRG